MIENKIQKFFIENHLTLGLAESCTGGGLSARLVQVPGCSLYFLGSIVAYSKEVKEKLLGVKSQTLLTFGEVSGKTAEEMALGALKQFKSDYALAITGIAGPTGGSIEKPVGKVFFSLVSREEPPTTYEHQFQGERHEIIAQSIEMALAHLWKYVNS